MEITFLMAGNVLLTNGAIVIPLRLPGQNKQKIQSLVFPDGSMPVGFRAIVIVDQYGTY
jgi:hypothetical protein